MDSFLKLVYELLLIVGRNIYTLFAGIFTSLYEIFIGCWGDYTYTIKVMTNGFSVFQWMLTILFCIVMLAIPVGIAVLIVMRVRRNMKAKGENISTDDLLKEIDSLNNHLLDLMDEKNKILAMKVSQLGLSPTGSAEAEPSDTPEKDKKESAIRFPKLHAVDMKYRDMEPLEYDDSLTLAEFAENFRNFMSSRLHLYYEKEVISLYIAGMACTRILILEGISGTGKTSLSYAFGQYMRNPTTIVSVQPSFRDRTELLGYFNEFSKKFNETEFLRAVYEAQYNEAPSTVLLDEMNLARIEYYFAEMLSVLEMPTPEEWVIDLVPTEWENDPEKMHGGKINISTSLWFVGTANNDDSTFTITDKVYDRAIPIELNMRAEPFEAPDTEPSKMRSANLTKLFAQAIEENPISATTIEKLEKLDVYLQTRFKLSFGNRIAKQMKAFVPVFVACGGTEMRALDYFIARKMLKKFESLNVAYVRDEIKELIVFLEKTFGKTSFPESKAYLQRIQNLF